ncbi:hypothetical protein [Vibrio mediterranei]|uniref:hypothetical protein n=1 Tax=Vibrio mediterranei TaxID=689 RepID=UPI001EFE86F1|nr:hypothetical protein [Vibrio mediterranei]MCG9657613.1 hypothetical protein [Vibrio mediterranei]
MAEFSLLTASISIGGSALVVIFRHWITNALKVKSLRKVLKKNVRIDSDSFGEAKLKLKSLQSTIRQGSGIRSVYFPTRDSIKTILYQLVELNDENASDYLTLIDAIDYFNFHQSMYENYRLELAGGDSTPILAEVAAIQLDDVISSYELLFKQANKVHELL